jgi:hypothetical protein
MSDVVTFAIFGAFILVCAWLGVRLLRFATRSASMPVLPTAVIANVRASDAAYAATARALRPSTPLIVRVLAFATGVVLLVAPWPVLYIAWAIGQLAQP